MKARGGIIILVLGVICLVMGAIWGFMDWADQRRNLSRQRRPIVVFVLDSSNSMMASSGEGTRLQIAKDLIRGLVNELQDVELGLVSFSGEAMVDFPPSVDREGFLTALAAVEPTMHVAPGSAPESGLIVAEGLCEDRAGIILMFTDGEEQVAVKAGNGWVNRRTPLGWCVIGAGAAMPIPLGQSWLRDPDTGEIAMSKPDEEQMRRWAELSSAVQVRLSSGAQGGEQLARVRGLLEHAVGEKSSSGRGNAHGGLAGSVWWGLSGSVLLMLGMWLSRRTLFVWLILVFFVGGARLPGESVQDLRGQLSELRGQLSSPSLSLSERVRLLTNGAGMLWHLGRDRGGDVNQRLGLVEEGISWCREALRCGGGEAATVNLQLLVKLKVELENERLHTLEAESGAGTGKNGKEERRRDDENLSSPSREEVDVDDVLGMAGGTGPAPTRMDNAPVQQDAEKSRQPEQVHGGADCWRSMMEKHGSIKPLPAGVKPW